MVLLELRQEARVLNDYILPRAIGGSRPTEQHSTMSCIQLDMVGDQSLEVYGKVVVSI